MRTPADKGGGGSKIGKILRTSFMYDPLLNFYIYNMLKVIVVILSYTYKSHNISFYISNC